VAVVEQIADGVIGPLLRKDVVGFDMADDVVAEGIRCCRHVAAAVVYGFLKNLGIAGMIVRIDKVIEYLLVPRVAAGVYDTDPDAVGIIRVNGG